ncbi:MAG: hypothetical protein KGI00_02090 [Candidatus Micrarchaeota archaeon]|nr:hypothetical protein [Candidatus Micrarchaeota archaeon]MDE1849499.1 hypothetical protein [Candidatus Micrarchaeota archaeon]
MNSRYARPKLTPEESFRMVSAMAMRLQGNFTSREVQAELTSRLRKTTDYLKQISERHMLEEIKGLARLDCTLAKVQEALPTVETSWQVMGKTPEERKLLYDAMMLAKRTEIVLFHYDNL